MHLGEQEVQELPERGVLGHALVAVDVVVAAPEGGLQHRRLAAAEPGYRGDRTALDRLIRERPVGPGFELGTPACRFLIEEEKIQAVGPHAVLGLRGRLRAQQGFEFF